VSQVLDAIATHDGRDRRWDDHRRARRRHLLDTAVALIDREGGDVGVAAICAAADVPRSVVYKLFRDREDLDEAIRGRIIRDLNNTMAPMIVPRGTTRQMVARGVKVYVQWVTTHPNLHQFLNVGVEARPTTTTSGLYKGKATFVHALEDLGAAALPPKVVRTGLARHLANGVVGFADATVNAWLAGGSDRGSAATLTKFVVEGACALIESFGRVANVDMDLDRPVSELLG
jgi:AcrR family transcriptional regulator